MQLTIREPGSAITHFIGCLMALIAASPLLIKAHGNATYMLAMTILPQVWFYCTRQAQSITVSVMYLPKYSGIFRSLITWWSSFWLPDLIPLSAWSSWAAELDIPFWLLYGELQWQESLSKDSGSPVRNGFLPSFTLPWAGRACRYLPGCGRISRMPHLAGF